MTKEVLLQAIKEKRFDVAEQAFQQLMREKVQTALSDERKTLYHAPHTTAVSSPSHD